MVNSGFESVFRAVTGLVGGEPEGLFLVACECGWFSTIMEYSRMAVCLKMKVEPFLRSRLRWLST